MLKIVLGFFAVVLFFIGFLAAITLPIMNQLHLGFSLDIGNLAVLTFILGGFILGAFILWLSVEKEE